MNYHTIAVHVVEVTVQSVVTCLHPPHCFLPSFSQPRRAQHTNCLPLCAASPAPPPPRPQLLSPSCAIAGPRRKKIRRIQESANSKHDDHIRMSPGQIAKTCRDNGGKTSTPCHTAAFAGLCLGYIDTSCSSSTIVVRRCCRAVPTGHGCYTSRRLCTLTQYIASTPLGCTSCVCPLR
jgi:hypothetical protein